MNIIHVKILHRVIEITNFKIGYTNASYRTGFLFHIPINCLTVKAIVPNQKDQAGLFICVCMSVLSMICDHNGGKLSVNVIKTRMNSPIKQWIDPKREYFKRHEALRLLLEMKPLGLHCTFGWMINRLFDCHSFLGIHWSQL